MWPNISAQVKKHENFHVKWVKHADFNGTYFENISNGESQQSGMQFALCQICSKQFANARNLKIGMGTVIYNQIS